MKKLFYSSLIFCTIATVSCKKNDDIIDPVVTTIDTTTTTTTTNNNDYSSISNNSATVNGHTTNFTAYMATYVATEVNSGNDYYDIILHNPPYALENDRFQILLGEIPSKSKELSWQSGSSAPGNITADEFAMYPKINGETWYGEYSTDGWATTGKVQVTVNGDKMTLAFADIELADNYITANVSKREKIKGKFTFQLSDLNSLTESWQTFDLVAE